MDEFKERIKKLKEQRKQASHANYREVLEENERAKKPPNWEKKIERDLKRLHEAEAKQRAEEAGLDYKIQKGLNYQADEIDRWERSKTNKRRLTDTTYVDFEEAARRKYEKSAKQYKPDMEEYNKLKEELGEDKFYIKDVIEDLMVTSTRGGAGAVASAASTSSSAISPMPPASSVIKNNPHAIERMAAETHKQIEARGKRTRRRRFDDDADVDYINERNMRFNKKLERYYGESTTEIKKNLERGTAL